MAGKATETAHFNSRPHGGRRDFIYFVVIRGDISTHALTEGDVGNHRVVYIALISTHALTEGDCIAW